jgi:protein phosphatase
MRDIRDLETTEFQVPVIPDFLQWPEPNSSLVQIDFGAATHPGKIRPHNEDSYIIYQVGRYWEKLFTSLNEGEVPDRHEEHAYAMAVADGIGGNSGGEVASSMAIKVCVSLVLNSARWALKLDNPETRTEELTDAKRRIEEYFRKVDAALTQYADKYPRLLGMGTTLTGAYTSGNDLFTMHVGDSRAYLFRGGQLKQLTRDQTLVQALVEAGTIKPEEVHSHYLRHTLTSCLGGQNGEVNLDIQHWRLHDGDRVLLCSDGLTEMVREPDIAQVLANNESSHRACQALVDLAVDNGGRDNVTVLVARHTWPTDKQPGR